MINTVAVTWVARLLIASPMTTSPPRARPSRRAAREVRRVPFSCGAISPGKRSRAHHPAEAPHWTCCSALMPPSSATAPYVLHLPDWQPDNGAHVATLPLVSGPSGPRPDLDVAEGHPVAAALACMVAYDGAVRSNLPRSRDHRL